MGNTVLYNIHVILSAMWRQRYLIVVPIILMPLLGLFIGMTATKKWENHTTILVQESAKINPFLEDLSVSTNLNNRMGALDSLLHSRSVLREVAQEQNLISETDSDRASDYVIDRLSANLQVKMIGKDLVKISYLSTERDNMKQVLTSVSEKFVRHLLTPEEKSITDSEAFLNQQLEQRRKELELAEDRLAQFKQANATDLPDMHQANTQRLIDLRAQAESLRITLSGAKAEKKAIRERLSQVDSVMKRLEANIVNAKEELAVLRARYTDEHSKVKKALRKIDRLELERQKQQQKVSTITDDELSSFWNMANQVDQVNQNPANSILLLTQIQELQEADSKVVKLEQELTSVEQQLKATKASMSNFGSTEKTLLELQRDLDVKRDMYTDLLDRHEKAQVTGALGRFENPQRIKVIDQPYDPLYPITFAPIVYVILGLVAGIGLGASLCFINECFDSTVRRRAQIEDILGVPVISRIPAITPTNDPRIIEEVNS